ncbi:cupin-like domain-containing protein [Rheinheimera sp.]|uniref:cupin-like domain-containing protein n=1 Tax=Rheinheimera sp. TaxID=1869214 RepID=UPI00307E8127
MERLTGISQQQFFQDIVPARRPVILSGLVTDWPVTQAALQSPAELHRYLVGFDNGTEVDTLLLDPATKGEVFYSADMMGFNFERRKYPVAVVLQQLLKIAGQPGAIHIALQSAELKRCLPGLMEQNPTPYLSADIVGRIWLGNRITVPTHLDHADNLACVVAGRRVFTLFPPEQVQNLYIGPVDFAPTGAPISMVRKSEETSIRYPKFSQAKAASLRAELEPGDVLFLPALWWHQVESLDDVNLLLNYWWGGSIGSDAVEQSPYDAMLHSMMALNGLPDDLRNAWASLFEYFVLRKGADQFVHIPPEVSAMQRDLTSKRKKELLTWLISQLQKHQEKS